MAMVCLDLPPGVAPRRTGSTRSRGEFGGGAEAKRPRVFACGNADWTRGQGRSDITRGCAILGRQSGFETRPYGTRADDCAAWAGRVEVRAGEYAGDRTSAAADEGHFGGHDGHELDVGLQRQISHVDDGLRH